MPGIGIGIKHARPVYRRSARPHSDAELSGNHLSLPAVSGTSYARDAFARTSGWGEVGEAFDVEVQAITDDGAALQSSGPDGRQLLGTPWLRVIEATDDPMRILLVAPQPYLQDRGTPLAVDHLLRVLSARGDRIDLLTYHEGRDVEHANVTIHRIRPPRFVRGIRPGFSWKKLICDLYLAAAAVRLARRNRYQVIHAIEEGAYIALVVGRLFGVRYIYDMDSSLGDQLIEAYPFLRVLRPVFNMLERVVARRAAVVVPVCSALAANVARHGPKRQVILRDVSLLGEPEQSREAVRVELGVRGHLVLYVGNLEPYQGIDLLIDSFAIVAAQDGDAELAIVGGASDDIARYRRMAEHRGIGGRVHFAGPRPVSALADYLSAADVLVSPRIKGNNTPMKVYSYLHVGRPVVATALPTHTQVLDSDVALLAEPTPQAFADAVLRLLGDPELRAQLSDAGKALVEQKYSFPAFERTLNDLYSWLEAGNSGGGRITA